MTILKSSILICSLFLLNAADAQKTGTGGKLETFYVWKLEKGDTTGFYHWLPNLLVTDKGTVLAYSDARMLNNREDGAPSHAVLKRSTNNGKTWSASQYIGYSDKGQNYLFTVAIQDRVTKKIFLFYSLRTHQRAVTSEVLYKTSSDDGVSWSEPISVTQQLVDNDSILQKQVEAGTAGPGFPETDARFFARKLFVTGPGTAIQLRADHPLHPNRLVIPVFAMKERWGDMNERGYGNTILYSDDNGKSWQAGGITPLGDYHSSELTIAELDNGDLLMNARIAEPKYSNARTLSISKDAGKTWTVPELHTKLPPSIRTGNGMAVYNFSEEDRSGRSRLIYSFPNDSLKRRNMSLALSYDGAKSWPVVKTVYADLSYYSNVAVTKDKKILLIYSSGEKEGHEVMIARFDLDWLTEGKDQLKSKS